jgi:DNA-binding MarR family transcriptional regulator
MNINKNVAIIESIHKLRSWCAKNLPIDNSFIAYDLLLQLSIHDYSKRDLSVKQLYASIPYSYTAIRIHYQRFFNDGWIENYSSKNDGRIKYIRPTKKLLEVINLYAKTAEELLIIEFVKNEQS